MLNLSLFREKSVSYTHLDVYKRQLYCFRLRKLFTKLIIRNEVILYSYADIKIDLFFVIMLILILLFFSITIIINIRVYCVHYICYINILHINIVIRLSIKRYFVEEKFQYRYTVNSI